MAKKPKFNRKELITRGMVEKLGLNENDLKKFKVAWWMNPRNKPVGGLRLTSIGYEALKKLDVEEYNIQLHDSTQFTNQLFLWLDNFIDSPFYLTKDEIRVFDSSIAVQLILFSGNIQKFGLARAKSVALKKEINPKTS